MILQAPMRKRFALGITGIFLTFALTLIIKVIVTSASTTASSCGPAHAKTLAENNQIRLYEVDTSRTRRDRGMFVFACMRSSGQRRRLGPIRQDEWYAFMPGPFVLAAQWAGGIELRQIGQDTQRIFGTTRNLPMGLGTRCLIGGGSRPGEVPKVKRLLIDNKGSLVWAATRVATEGGFTSVIGVCESTGARVLDSGEAIDFASLRLSGSTLTWTNSGARQTARLH